MAHRLFGTMSRKAVPPSPTGELVSPTKDRPVSKTYDQLFMPIPLSKLELGKRLGAGSFGEVYRAKYNKEDVAVKFSTQESEFRQELLTLTLFSHPNIIKVIGADITGPRYHMVLELGTSALHNEIREKDYTLADVYHWTLQIAEGMEEIHKRGLVHRDLKTSNILLRESTVKICDFGTARRVGTDPKTLTVAGTVGYMAPEVLKGKAKSNKCDVYSFAMVVWELLTGEVPFGELNAVQVIFSVGAEGLRLPIPEGIPERLESLITECWKQDPQERPSFTQVLENYRNHMIADRAELRRAVAAQGVEAPKTLRANQATFKETVLQPTIKGYKNLLEEANMQVQAQRRSAALESSPSHLSVHLSPHMGAQAATPATPLQSSASPPAAQQDAYRQATAQPQQQQPQQQQPQQQQPQQQQPPLQLQQQPSADIGSASASSEGVPRQAALPRQPPPGGAAVAPRKKPAAPAPSDLGDDFDLDDDVMPELRRHNSCPIAPRGARRSRPRNESREPSGDLDSEANQRARAQSTAQNLQRPGHSMSSGFVAESPAAGSVLAPPASATEPMAPHAAARIVSSPVHASSSASSEHSKSSSRESTGSLAQSNLLRASSSQEDVLITVPLLVAPPPGRNSLPRDQNGMHVRDGSGGDQPQPLQQPQLLRLTSSTSSLLSASPPSPNHLSVDDSSMGSATHSREASTDSYTSIEPRFTFAAPKHRAEVDEEIKMQIEAEELKDRARREMLGGEEAPLLGRLDSQVSMSTDSFS